MDSGWCHTLTHLLFYLGRCIRVPAKTHICRYIRCLGESPLMRFVLTPLSSIPPSSLEFPPSSSLQLPPPFSSLLPSAPSSLQLSPFPPPLSSIPPSSLELPPSFLSTSFPPANLTCHVTVSPSFPPSCRWSWRWFVRSLRMGKRMWHSFVILTSRASLQRK